MKTELIQYVRNEKDNNLRGIIIARKVSNSTVIVGWSYTNITWGDIFDKKLAYKIASGRIETETDSVIPIAITRIFEKMANRARKYFKVENVFIVGKHP